MLPTEFAEPYIDEDQLIELDRYKDELVTWMLEETQNGRDPIGFYREIYTDAMYAIADLIENLQRIDGTNTKRQEKFRTKIYGCMIDVIIYTLLMSYGLEIELPDAEVLEVEMSMAPIEAQASPTLAAMMLTDGLGALSYDFFVKRLSDDLEKEACFLTITSMIAALGILCQHLDVTFFDVIYSQ